MKLSPKIRKAMSLTSCKAQLSFLSYRYLKLESIIVLIIFFEGIRAKRIGKVSFSGQPPGFNEDADIAVRLRFFDLTLYFGKIGAHLLVCDVLPEDKRYLNVGFVIDPAAVRRRYAFHKGTISVLFNESNDVKQYYSKMVCLLSNDFPYRQDMQLFLPLFDFYRQVL